MGLLHHWLVGCLPAHGSVKAKRMKRIFFSPYFLWSKPYSFSLSLWSKPNL